MNRRKQNGVALITALLVVSLATILAVSLVDHLNFDVRRTENILRMDQAQLYNANAVEFGMSLLRLDRELNNEHDTLMEYGDHNLQVYPVTGGQVSAKILDQQGCFNLNNLAGSGDSLARNRAIYSRLLSQLGIDDGNVNTLVDSLIDWLDSNDISEVFGAEFDYYLGLQPPYQTANTLMTSVSELRLVKGYSGEVVEQLENHICVLPSANSLINVNTASLEMLESIDGLEGQGERIIRDRDGNPETLDDDAPFAELSDFKEYVKNQLKIKQFNSTGLQVHSEYFLMHSSTQLGTGNVSLYSMMYRNQSDGKTELIRQSRSTL